MTGNGVGSILFVDAYDSFAENIAALLNEQLKVHVTIIKIDCDIQQEFERSHHDFFSSFDAIVLGPGPGNPYNRLDIGLFADIWQYATSQTIPVLGICLGFQSLCVQNHVPVTRLSLPCHGHAKEVFHDNGDIFGGIRSLLATCYNSLGVHLRDFKQNGMLSRPTSSGSDASVLSNHSHHSTTAPSTPASSGAATIDLEVLAWDKDGYVMAIKHKCLPFHGFQFHPESCKSTQACHILVGNWWEAAIAHNQRNRPCHSPGTIATRSTQRPRSTSLSNEAKNFLRDLQSCPSSHRGTLQRKCLRLPNASAMIADLCRYSSALGRIAMLESTKRGKYSIYAFSHEKTFIIEYKAGQLSCYQQHPSNETFKQCSLDREEAMALLQTFVHDHNFNDTETRLPFRGGFIGFMSYEFGAASLKLGVSSQDRHLPPTPDFSLVWVDRCVVYDNDTGVAYVQSIRGEDPWVEEMVATLHTQYADLTEPSCSTTDSKQVDEILSSAKYTLPDHDRYISQIRACQNHLLAGNSYELCLTTEATVTTPATTEAPYLLYRNIQRHNPVPFAAFLNLNKTTILSSSPEQFLSWSNKDATIDMIPMKGTVKKHSNMTLAKASAILSSAKESAENLMIADLIRHDLYSTVGRDAKVEVVKLCDVVESETVYSLVSHIRAHVPLSPNESTATPDKRVKEMTQYGIRALTRTLPPGSMTGAPKKRSCEILHDLEQRHRGVYSGAIGYIDVCGNGAWSVCIRSAFSNSDDNTTQEFTGEERQTWHVGAGGAITVLSDEEAEWQEMMTKLDSVLRGMRQD